MSSNNSSNSPSQSRRKLSKAEKEVKIQKEREKFTQMIDSFFEKSKHRIDKYLTKDNKKTSLICKQLLGEISQHPKQELY